ncbi:MAG: Eco57I restriction-modification methylase domain-containing protein [Helicobacteraceae bacterium]|nr:Eco57I restriction-modification methylase domain-containing protein [Helicobacteraceae bacterium]
MKAQSQLYFQKYSIDSNNIKEFLNPLYLEYKDFSNLETFKNALESYLNDIDKNHKLKGEDSLVAEYLAEFFKQLGFKTSIKKPLDKANNAIDLSLCGENVEVIIEAKKPGSAEMFYYNGITNTKALAQSIYYYYKERKSGNFDLKFIIITDFYQFYIFKAAEFERFFYNNKHIKNILDKYEDKDKSVFKDSTLKDLYEEIQKALTQYSFSNDIKKENILDIYLNGFYINLRNIDLKTIKQSRLELLYKIFHRDFLHTEFRPDANTINQKFYDELLYILGLQETKAKTITQNKEQDSTFFQMILNKLKEKNKEASFENAMSLVILWLNRILFLKIAESNLEQINSEFKEFLTHKIIDNYETLSNLFFSVLNVPINERKDPAPFESVPYYNSSLFTKSQDLEQKLLEIKDLDSNLKISYYQFTCLRGENGKKKEGEISFLAYLFDFLEAWDFSDIRDSIKIKDIDMNMKRSVLGLIFEKLNGYKEGSFYTPAKITSFMCKEALEKIVISKFNDFRNKNIDPQYKHDIKPLLTLEDVRDYTNATTQNKQKHKEILKSIKLCDPAVGSGHFLVSSLNAILEIYSTLGLLESVGEIKINNDELLIFDKDSKPFIYKKPQSLESQNHKAQEELFILKKEIIENNLFGVDINDNSCNIAKLRLWLELLESSYYTKLTSDSTNHLQTLPNIDINIKCGNSLIYDIPLNFTKDSLQANIKEYRKKQNLFLNNFLNILDNDLSQKFQEHFENYKQNFKAYQESSKEQKEIIENNLRKNIKDINSIFLRSRSEYIELYDLLSYFFENYGYNGIRSEFFEAIEQIELESYLTKWDFPKEINFSREALKDDNKAIIKKEATKLQNILNNFLKLRDSTNFEWRYIFPAVCEKDSFDFLGFDLIIGNPPYIRQEAIKHLKPSLEKQYKEFYCSTADIYTYFFKLGFALLKDGGILSFITSNKYTRANYGENLRKFLLDSTTLLSYVDLNGDKVFESATVDTSILSYKRAKNVESQKDSTYLYSKTTSFKDALELKQSALSKDAFVFLTPQEAELKAKIEKAGTPLKNWGVKIYRGILTGLNEAFIIDSTKRGEILESCKSESERERTNEIIKPLLRGRDIKQYSYKWAGLWVINTHSGIESKGIEPIDISKYPALKAYLDNFYPQLEKRSDKGVTPYNLRHCAYFDEFGGGGKIVWAEMTKESCFAYDDKGYFTNQTCYFIPNANIYLCGILNSKVIYFYMQKIASSLGDGAFRWIKQFIEKLPIKKPTKKQEAKMIELVKEITKLKADIQNATSSDHATKINELAKEKIAQIDALVYKLYDLSEEEIQVIEKG